MPPTRGHDLKLCLDKGKGAMKIDAPHTGARLETNISASLRHAKSDAPHTGARLETPSVMTAAPAVHSMPPTRGHDLKLNSRGIRIWQVYDAPHTGARLETGLSLRCFTWWTRCPPHGGTT